MEGKSDEELKLLGIKVLPDMDLSQKDQSFIDGMFEARSATSSERNDSLTNARQAIRPKRANQSNEAYNTWLTQTRQDVDHPLTGSLR